MKKYIFANLATCLLLSYTTNAQKPEAVAEKKVDFLEKIYFSGKNKVDLNTLILIALQELEGKSPTPALARQVAFLIGIKDNAAAADDACEILEMFSIGIYNIDAAEASAQKIILASGKKAKATTATALESITKLNNSALNINNSATNLGWSSYYLGSSNFGNGAFKVAGKAASISNALGAAGEMAKTADQIRIAAKNIFKKKDKPCDDVPEKNIEIGEHIVPGAATAVQPIVTTSSTNSSITQTTIISIPRVSYAVLRSLADSIKNKTGVQSVEKSYTEALSTITITHAGSTDAIADWLEDKFATRFTLKDAANDNGKGKINLVAKAQ